MALIAVREVALKTATTSWLLVLLCAISIHLQTCDGQNASPPTFINVPTAAVPISEDASIGDTVFTCTGTDPDSDTSLLTFHIIAGNDDGVFSISDASSCVVTLAKQPDFEMTSSYSLTLEVADNDAFPTPLSSQHVFVVDVQDVNEFDPVFVDVPPLPITLQEDASSGTSVLTCSVQDNDSPAQPSGQHAFNITDGNTDGVFSLDSSTCLLTVSGQLDFETTPHYDVIIQATDKDPNAPRSSNFTFTIDVQDVNEKPTFKNLPAGPEDVAENTAVGTTIFTCTARDQDDSSLPRGQLEYSIKSGNEDGKFSVDSSTCAIQLVAGLDFETRTDYELEIRAMDQDPVQRMSVLRSLKLHVTDVNEHTPVFTNVPTTPTKVAETKKVGSEVLTCTATDDDSSTEPSGQLQYTIIGGNDDSKFAVDSTSCLVTVNDGLDFETKDAYSLTFQACDLDISPKCSTQVFDVEIVDKNESPVFDNPVSSPSVMENLPAGTLVFQCSATDEDNPSLPRGQLSFSLVSGNEDAAFTFTPPCRVETARPLDIEQRVEYELEIEVTDLDPDKPLNATHVFKVKVDDENDNTPYFFDIPPMPIVVPEDTLVGVPFWNCSGDDDDVDFELSGQEDTPPLIAVDILKNYFCLLLISDGNGEKFFELNPSNCSLSLQKPLDYEKKTLNFNLTVRLSDLDPTSPRSVEEVFELCVQNVNDNKPRWVTELPDKIEIMENSELSIYLGNCSASDADPVHDHSGLVRYRIKSGNKLNLFYLDPYTCELWINGLLDYEQKKGHTLKIQAYDLDPVAPLNSPVMKVYVRLLDENDMGPQCVAGLVTTEVSEATKARTVVMALNCSDVDSGASGSLQYLSRSDSDVIKVDKRTGQIKLLRTVDWDTEQHMYEMKVEVTDKGTPANSASATVRLLFVDADDIPPVWDSGAPYNASLSEDTARGSHVTLVGATDDDKADTLASTVVFGFESTPDPDWFVINKYTGEILTKTSLDWEERASVTFQVHAYSSDQYDARVITDVTVTIDDVNDRKPVFEQELYAGSVRENMATGTPILTVTALDPDSGQDGQVQYSIQDGPFQIDQTSGEITVKETLNYDSLQIYRVTVTASDLGTPSMTSQVDVIITVLPENEFTPSFVGGLVVYISEDIPPGTSVFQLSATDEDTGLDGTVWFSSSSSSTDLPFIVDDEGKVFLAAPLDFETVRNYSLPISVSDRSTTSPKSATSALQIIITDVNDLAPGCQRSPLAVSLYPWTSSASIATVDCVDDADTVNGQLEYSIIDSSSGELTVVAKPQQSSYDLLVEVSDGGNPQQTTSVSLPVIVEPEMTLVNLPDDVSFPENTAYGTVLFPVQTCCSWVPVKVEIVSGNDRNLFHLHHLTGDLVLLGQLDREVTSLHQLTITATDERGQTSTSTLDIHVLDDNDNTPIVTPVHSSVKIGELLPVGSIFAHVTATDADIGNNADITLGLQDTFDSTFSVDQNGDLKLEKSLDFESRQSYTLVITATDGGTPPLVGSATIQVNLVNADEFSPQFINGGGSVTLLEDSPVGVAVLVVSASDQDIPDVISYAIVTGNDDSTFFIRSDDGQVLLLKTLDRETVNSYTLGIQASNSLGDDVTISVQIHVADVDDNDPLFSSSVYEMHVPHDTAPGTILGHVTVTDADMGTNADFTVSIISGNIGNVFTLDGTAVKTAKTVRYDGIKEFVLVLRAEGTGGGTAQHRHSLAAVNIKVQPPLATPKFSNVTDTMSLPEDAHLDLLVYDFDATQLGASEGIAGNLRYVLRAGNADNHFTLDDKTGALYLVLELDYETRQSYALVVDAESRDNAAVKDTATLTVDVLNVNDNTPRPASAVFEFTVREDAANGELVGQVTFTDADDGAAGDVTLTMTGCDEFAVDPANGDVTVVGALDYGVVSIHDCLVSAVDGSSPTRTGAASVIISVLDVNNNAPVFQTSPYTVNLNENTAQGVTVGIVRATDSDSGSNSDVTYSLTSGDPSGTFSLDPVKGTLLLVGTLYVRVTPQYVLQVKASDGGIVQQTALTAVTVNVVDVNDHRPVFTEQSVDVPVDRTAAVGQMLTTVTATDDDLGSNAQITYIITAGNTGGLFAVDGATGEFTTAASLLEADDTYTITITARDHGVPIQTGDITVNVFVSPPKAPSGSSVSVLAFSVDENKAVGYVVGTVTPYPATSAVGYTIVSGNFEGSFELVKQADGTAALRVAKPLDHETYPWFQLLVDVDTGNSQTVGKLVKVEVLDVNDNSPKFSDPSIVVFVPENSPVGHTIWTLSVEDADNAATNGQIVFSVIPPDNPLLDVTAEGALFLKSSPDFEALQQLDVVVEAHDSGVPEMTSSVSVTLHVIDVEETQEVQVSSASTVYISTEIPYNAKVGQLVHQLTIANFPALTASPSATVSFLALDTAGAFSVNAATGEVTVTSPAKLQDGAAYFQWVVCRMVEAGGAVTSELAMLRVDTFDKYKHLVALQVASEVADVEADRLALLSRLQARFSSPHRVGIFSVIAHGSTARRRLLASQSLVLVYVVLDEAVDDLRNVRSVKRFLTQEQILQILQQSPDGTPVDGISMPSLPVDLVMPYQTGEETEEEKEFMDSTGEKKARVVSGKIMAGGGKVFTTPFPGFFLSDEFRRGSDISASSTTSLLDDDSGMGDSFHSARKSLTPSSPSNASARSGDESPFYILHSVQVHVEQRAVPGEMDVRNTQASCIMAAQPARQSARGSTSYSRGAPGWLSSRRDPSDMDERPPWLPSNPYARPGFHRGVNSRLTTSSTDVNSENNERVRLKDQTPGHEVTWQPKRNGPVQIFSEKLHWHAVSTIPKASPRREDALARDPVFAGWAKSLARRKRNAEEAPSKASVKPKKAEPSGKSGDKEKEKEAVDADDILASFTPRRSILYNAPTHSWF
ncbi:hypothetical protein BaRGS_00012568 [Batillaria attramentaria]|uniref:Cadherin domain-containing protein n=1 Tax=Batillaria attramentaria TaxID=370345 RepID=A0ABD0LAA9_9CAEN